MAAVDTAPKEASAVALPGLGRALMSAGKLTQKAAEDIYKKSQTSRTSFIAELTGSGAVSAADLAHTVSAVFGAPLLDLDAIDPLRLPKELLDGKICQAYRVVVLSKRNNRLIVATADPTDQEAAEKIKFTTQMGVDWIIAEYDKLSRLVETTTKSASESLETLTGGGGDFEFIIKENELEILDQKMDINCSFLIEVRKKNAAKIVQLFNDLRCLKIQEIKH